MATSFFSVHLIINHYFSSAFSFADYFIPQRYVIGLLGFLAFALTYVQRFCLSMAITEMAHQEHKVSNKTIQCPVPQLVRNQTISKVRPTDLSKMCRPLCGIVQPPPPPPQYTHNSKSKISKRRTYQHLDLNSQPEDLMS